ncbi:hypothetical protein [Methylophilus sp.]|uniref:hypothetical protein n=1 Tax=Methylophilus sp. TaxID=29541 RepID=UPI004035CE2E
MINLNLTPEDLSFLKLLDSNRHEEFRQCQYLVTNYEANIWTFRFSKRESYTLDFNVSLDDKSLLTETRNKTLLNLLKSWICIQTHYDVTGVVSLHSGSAFNNIRIVVVLIDYLLLNSEHFKLSLFGLKNITENDLINLMAQLASSNESAIGVYQWPYELENYLRAELAVTDTQKLLNLVVDNPLLGTDIPVIEDRVLSLNDEEIVLARALLWSRGQYKVFNINHSEVYSYRYAPDSDKLGRVLFPNTLRGKSISMLPPELLLSPLDMYAKEFKRAPVRNDAEKILNESVWNNYTKALRSLGLLKEISDQLPISALNAFTSSAGKNHFSLSIKGRYATLPPELVLNSLRKAMEFCFSYGPDILNSVLNVITDVKRLNLSKKRFGPYMDVSPFITPKLSQIGVIVWNLKQEINGLNQSSEHRISTYDFFTRMRKNEGLYELLRVYFGAVQFCVGTLMARRQDELIKLVSGKVLDKDKRNLIFDNGKSGTGEIRVKEARPVPDVVVKLIEQIENFHEKLRQIGATNQKVQLFSYPSLINGNSVLVTTSRYNSNLEIFCDYIQTPLNEEGERYYFRQHQLRRFFSMLFFWGNSFGKMDTLQWFLGHTDIQHLYHYITETTPGHVLIASKAYYGCELIKSNPLASPMLAELVEKHFGTKHFSVLDSAELIEYIEELQVDNRVQIEPIFFDGPKGKTYQIAIHVNRISED